MYWLTSPFAFNDQSGSMLYITSNGALLYHNYSLSHGVRPLISLAHDIEYVSGDGSMANPYIVDAPPINVSNASYAYGDPENSTTTTDYTTLNKTVFMRLKDG
ncbi:MAG: hypothetical protein IJ568_07080, partial [Bacilli bacterium]|nr:hypothetical protein [Bacilli bacterium]